MDSDEELRNDLRANYKEKSGHKDDNKDEESENEGEDLLTKNLEKHEKEYDTKDKEGEVFNASVDSIKETPKKSRTASNDEEIE